MLTESIVDCAFVSRSFSTHLLGWTFFQALIRNLLIRNKNKRGQKTQ